MSLKKCFHCNKTTYTPFHITEISKGTATHTYDLCKKCGEIMTNQPVSSKIDLDHITTPEQLLQFIAGIPQFKEKTPVAPCPQCGLTEAEFDVKGRFGCPKCYEHFKKKMKQLVFPYHNANSHQGKMPKKLLANKWVATTDEHEKFLKLKLAKAIELEEYEEASRLKNELNNLNHPKPQSTSEDQ